MEDLICFISYSDICINCFNSAASIITTLIQSTPSVVSTSSSSMMNSDTFGNFFINNIWQILLSIIGGIITVAIIEIVRYARRKYFRKKFKKVVECR